MKKYILGFLMLSLCIACSEDEVITNDVASAELTSTTNFESTDLTTATPNRIFDVSSEGLYHGVIVTEDTQFHGKIWVNIGNDGNYNATVETDLGEKLSFTAQQNSLNGTSFVFQGERGSFYYDVSDFSTPVASEVIIDDTFGFIQTVKDNSTSRAAVTLGTFVDFADPAYTGTWDLITDGTANAGAFGLPNLTQVCVVGPNGIMLVDTGSFETFDYPCFTLAGPIAPVFHAAGGTFGNINEFWAQDQVTDWGGASASNTTYFLGQSTSVHSGNPQFDTPGFHNNDFAAMPTPGCNAFTGGLQGIWFWNGRVGSATFVDPFAPPPPPSQSIVDALQAHPLANPQTINTIDSSIFE